MISERVLQSLQAPFLLDGREVFVGASIGIAFATARSASGAGHARRRRRHVPRQGRRQGPPRDLRRRDARAGRAPAEPGERAPRRRSTTERWRSATSRSCRPRPAASSASRRSVAGRCGEPAEVLAMAEETGLAVPLGRQILRAACEQLAEWRTLPRGAGLTVGVNVSARQLGAPDFVAMLRATLRESGLDPRALRLEVSEQRPLARPRRRRDPPRARAGARAGRRAHAHRPLRDGRLAAAAAAPLPGRRDQDLARAGDRDRPATRARSRSCARSSAWRTTSGSR